MKTFAKPQTISNQSASASSSSKAKQSAVSGGFVIGADAPPLSKHAKELLSHKKPSKRAAKLAATVEKANVRCIGFV